MIDWNVIFGISLVYVLNSMLVHSIMTPTNELRLRSFISPSVLLAPPKFSFMMISGVFYLFVLIADCAFSSIKWLSKMTISKLKTIIGG